VADDDRFDGQLLDDLVEVIRDLADGLAGEDFGVGVGLLGGVRVVGPPRDHRGIAGIGEDARPAVPAAGQ
jgi:hypothetical protein